MPVNLGAMVMTAAAEQVIRDVPSWVGILIGVIGVALTYVSYRSQRNRKRMEFLVLSNQRLLTSRVAGDLDVAFNGETVEDPSIVVLRMVSTGDKAILKTDFHSPLAIVIKGARRIVTASVAAKRPRDLDLTMTSEGNRVVIEPTLINPEDFLEIQILASGQATHVALEGRIADVVLKRREELPYPPGSGPEGEMLGFDRFMWIVMPIVFFCLVLPLAWVNDLSLVARGGTLVGAGTLAFIAYPLQLRALVRRRRIWRS